MNPAQIPAELRERDQWVVWRHEKRGGRWTKVPYQVDGRTLAESDNPATWGSFDQALVRAQHEAQGAGYVFSETDPYTGVDIDGCIDQAGELHPDAAELLSELDSYRERSPSRIGLHVIVKATLLGDGRGRETKETPWRNGDRHELGIYDRRRFFTVTGGQGLIAERQEQVDQLLTQWFPATNYLQINPAGERPTNQLLDTFPRLGQILRHEVKPPRDDSPSGWDYYLCCESVRCGCTDPEIAALIRAHRPGDPKAGRVDYLSRTLAKARKAVGKDAADRISKRWGLTTDPIVSGRTIGDVASGAAVVYLHRQSGSRLRLPSIGDLFEPRKHTQVVSLAARSRFAPLNTADAVEIAQLVVELCGGNDDDPLEEARQWIADFIGGLAETIDVTLEPDGKPGWNALHDRHDAQVRLDAAQDRRAVAMRDTNGELWLPAGPLRATAAAGSNVTWPKLKARLLEIGWRREQPQRWQPGKGRLEGVKEAGVFYVGRDDDPQDTPK